jgi:hypothetical protein
LHQGGDLAGSQHLFFPSPFHDMVPITNPFSFSLSVRDGPVPNQSVRRHRELIKPCYGEYSTGFVHHRFAILVDKEAKPPGTGPGVDTRATNAHVIILDMWWFDLAE